MNKKWDVFISHASEDKDSIVRELAAEMQKFHIKVWYDEFALTVGDSLLKSIDEGLIHSNFGIIIISSNFLKKKWTDYEYRSLLSREIDGKKVLLPIWHNVTKAEIKEFSLYLSDKLALETSKNTVQQLSIKLIQVIKPTTYENLCRYFAFKKIIENAEPTTIKISDLKKPSEPRSKLSKQLLVRAKSIFYGIGQNLSMSLGDSIYNYELDLRPDREIQTWEIMNACYLEFIHKNKITDPEMKKSITNLLIGFSIGELIDTEKLTESMQVELYNNWKDNYYEY